MKYSYSFANFSFTINNNCELCALNYFSMKDQKAILLKCIKNDEPAFVIAGHDISSIEVLEAYYTISKDKGASPDFLEDMKLVIEEFKTFHQQEPDKITMPKLNNVVHL